MKDALPKYLEAEIQRKELEAEIRKFFNAHPEIFEVGQNDDSSTETELDYHVRVVAEFVTSLLKCCFCQTEINLEDSSFMSRHEGRISATCASCWLDMSSSDDGGI